MPNNTNIMTIGDVADYLRISEKTVHKMIREEDIPCTRIGNQWRFLRPVLDDWLVSRMNSNTPQTDLSRLLESSGEAVPLSRLTSPGMIVTGINAARKEELLRQITQPARNSGMILQPEAFIKGLVNREKMVSTALGNGIAVPHLRYPDTTIARGPRLCIGVSPEGIAFDAPDGKPVHIFFLLLADNEVVHLRILSRISRLAQKEPLAETLRHRTPEEIYHYLIQTESRLQRAVC